MARRHAHVSIPEKRKNEAPVTDAHKRPRLVVDDFFAHRVTVPNSPSMDSLGQAEAGGTTDVELSAEQSSVLKMVVIDGTNVFFTGSAGA